jgi:hypothetical protein
MTGSRNISSLAEHWAFLFGVLGKKESGKLQGGRHSSLAVLGSLKKVYADPAIRIEKKSNFSSSFESKGLVNIDKMDSDELTQGGYVNSDTSKRNITQTKGSTNREKKYNISERERAKLRR